MIITIFSFGSSMLFLIVLKSETPIHSSTKTAETSWSWQNDGHRGQSQTMENSRSSQQNKAHCLGTEIRMIFFKMTFGGSLKGWNNFTELVVEQNAQPEF